MVTGNLVTGHRRDFNSMSLSPFFLTATAGFEQQNEP